MCSSLQSCASKHCKCFFGVHLAVVYNKRMYDSEDHFELEVPEDSDCCGSGCEYCVFEVYRQKLAKYEQIRKNSFSEVNVLDKCLAISQTCYKPFKLVSVQKHTHNTYIYSFQCVECVLRTSVLNDCVEKCYPLGIGIGQHIVMRGCESNVGHIARAYTPISCAKVESCGLFQVLIKLYANGIMSNYIRHLEVGAIVDWRGPYGNFVDGISKYRHVVMLAAGTGVAPMYRVARFVTENEYDYTKITMLYTCKSFKDILLYDKLKELSLYWNFIFTVFLTEGKFVGKWDTEYVRIGKISETVVCNLLETKLLQDVLVLICGTNSFNESMKLYIKNVGFHDENIFVF